MHKRTRLYVYTHPFIVKVIENWIAFLKIRDSFLDLEEILSDNLVQSHIQKHDIILDVESLLLFLSNSTAAEQQEQVKTERQTGKLGEWVTRAMFQ